MPKINVWDEGTGDSVITRQHESGFLVNMAVLFIENQ